MKSSRMPTEAQRRMAEGLLKSYVVPSEPAEEENPSITPGPITPVWSEVEERREEKRQQLYVATLLVFDSGYMSTFSTRLFQGVPTGAGLKRAWEGVSSKVSEAEFVVAKTDKGVSVALLRDGLADSSVVVVVRKHIVLGEDGV